MRVFDPVPGRQEGRSIGAYSEADLRGIIASSIAKGVSPSIRIGADIVITKPLKIGISLILNAAAGVKISATCSPAIITQAASITIQGITFKAAPGCGVCISHVSGGDLRILDVDFVAGTSSFFTKALESIAIPVEVRRCRFQTQMALDTGAAGLGSIVTECERIVSGLFSPLTPYVQLGGGFTFAGNKIVNLEAGGSTGGVFSANDNCNLVLAAGAGSVAIAGNDSCDINTTAGTGFNVLAGNNPGGSVVLHANDVNSDEVLGRLMRTPQVFTSGTTYTPPAGCKAIVVEVVGGGAGGGGSSTAGVSAAGSGGGGAGGYARHYYASPGACTYAVGAAGAGGTTVPSNGVNGGDTTFTCSALTITGAGGNLGLAMTIGTVVSLANGGAGGGATNALVNGGGAPGGVGIRLSGTIAAAGAGGSGPLGSGGPPRVTGGASQAAAGFGAGGCGACVVNGSAAQAGGAGTAGVVIVSEYT